MKASPNRATRWLWFGIVACLVVAAWAGVLFRWGLVQGSLPGNLSFSHLRHAHSHLMYLGWLVPALFLVMTRGLQEERAQAGLDTALRRALEGWTWASLLTGALTFPAFLAWGYGPVSVGARHLPMAAMLSGLCVFAWYGFAWAWWRAQQGTARTHALRLWNLSLWMLALSSTGGWAQMGMNLRNIQHPFWSRATIHIFLDILALGFFMLAAIGTVIAMSQRRGRGWPTPRLPGEAAFSGALTMVAVAVPFTFLLGMRPEQLPGSGRVLGALAGLASAAALLGLTRHLGQLSALPLAIRVLAGGLFVGLGLAGLPWVLETVHAWELRLLWLHWVFLGVLTPATLWIAQEQGWARWPHAARATVGTAFVLLLSLVPMTGLWPASLRGPWVSVMALVAALLPALVLSRVGLDALQALSSRSEPSPQVGGPKG